MADFFSFMRTGLVCSTILGIAFMIALSLPKSRLRTVVTEICSYGAVAFCAFYAISPVDAVPSVAFGPLGFLDDLGILCLGWKAFVTAMESRQERQQLDAMEAGTYRPWEDDDEEDDVWDDDDDDDD